MFWFVFVIVVYFIFRYLIKKGTKIQLDKMRQKYNIPADAKTYNFQGGSSKLKVGKVFGYVDPNGINFISQNDGSHVQIPFSNIKGVYLNSDVQTIVSGGGRSLGGALVGEAIAGPVGALVGSRKKTKKETIDRSTVQLVTVNEGIESAMIFKGSQPTYNSLHALLESRSF